MLFRTKGQMHGLAVYAGCPGVMEHTARGRRLLLLLLQQLAQLESSGINWLQLLQCDRAYRDGDPDCSKQALVS